MIEQRQASSQGIINTEPEPFQFEDGPVLNAESKSVVAGAIGAILHAVGEDSSRDGIIDTPSRVARMYDELLSGYTTDPAKLLNNALFDV